MRVEILGVGCLSGAVVIIVPRTGNPELIKTPRVHSHKAMVVVNVSNPRVSSIDFHITNDPQTCQLLFEPKAGFIARKFRGFFLTSSSIELGMKHKVFVVSLHSLCSYSA
jgi:hypothetical protein